MVSNQNSSNSFNSYDRALSRRCCMTLPMSHLTGDESNYLKPACPVAVRSSPLVSSNRSLGKRHSSDPCACTQNHLRCCLCCIVAQEFSMFNTYPNILHNFSTNVHNPPPCHMDPLIILSKRSHPIVPYIL